MGGAKEASPPSDAKPTVAGAARAQPPRTCSRSTSGPRSAASAVARSCRDTCGVRCREWDIIHARKPSKATSRITIAAIAADRDMLPPWVVCRLRLLDRTRGPVHVSLRILSSWRNPLARTSPAPKLDSSQTNASVLTRRVTARTMRYKRPAAVTASIYMSSSNVPNASSTHSRSTGYELFRRRF